MVLKSCRLVEKETELSIVNRRPESSYYKNRENMKLTLSKRKHAKAVSCLLLSIIIIFGWLPLVAEAGGGGSGMYAFERIGRNYTNVAKQRNNDINNVLLPSSSSRPIIESGRNQSVEDKSSSENMTTTSVSSSSSSVSIAKSLKSQNQKKREIKLPLENLFPSTNSASSTTTPGRGGGGSKSEFESLKIPAHQQHQYINDREKLKSALLNHSLHSHDDDDKALDRLVFSQLPEGSKLILRTVKIVRTDDDGNEEDAGDEVTSWDVVLSNGTKTSSSNSNDQEDEDEDEEEFLSDEEEEDSGTNQNKQQQPNHDLISAASHPTSHYNSHGSNVQTKDKNTKYYDEKDHGKHRAQTFTDTDGTKVKNYKGNEKGLTDFDHSHGNAQSNEGGRFKDSKKKNKGRKVTGFKRVYHKEEFQRTEHFYDDEDLKRIAEQFGTNDQKEKSSHGLKGDDRTYHGIYKEHTDGEKVKNEKGTQDSFNKGHHQSHKDSEQLKHGQNYAQHQGGPVYGGRTRHHHPAPHHANHNYDGAYTTNKNKVASIPSNNGGSLASSTDPTKLFSTTSNSISSISLPLTENPNGLQSTSVSPDSKAAQRQVKSVSSSSLTGPKLPTMAMMAPDPQILLAKPSEMKVFFSPRERYFPYKENDATMAYAPNFGPGHPHQKRQKPGGYGGLATNNNNYKFKPPQHPHSKPLYGPRLHNFNHNPRYAGNFPINSKDVIPPLYSTIIKTIPHGNLISIDKSKEHPVIMVENVPSTTERTKKAVGRYRIRPQFGWIPINNNNNIIKHKDPLTGGTRDRPQIGFTKNPLSNLRLGKTVLPIMFIRKPTTPLPISSSSSNNNNNQVHIRPASTSGAVFVPPTQGGQPSNTVSYNVRRNPQFSNFMNGLMDSVAGFFGRIG